MALVYVGLCLVLFVSYAPVFWFVPGGLSAAFVGWNPLHAAAAQTHAVRGVAYTLYGCPTARLADLQW